MTTTSKPLVDSNEPEKPSRPMRTLALCLAPFACAAGLVFIPLFLISALCCWSSFGVLSLSVGKIPPRFRFSLR